MFVLKFYQTLFFFFNLYFSCFFVFFILRKKRNIKMVQKYMFTLFFTNGAYMDKVTLRKESSGRVCYNYS